MLKKQKDAKTSREINAGSMADIAFLLLIFFLVTTTIAADKGIPIKLPPYEEDIPPLPERRKERNVFVILVNKNNDLLVENKLMPVLELREATKEFLLNYGENPNLSESPKKAIVSIKNDRGTSYSAYISVYNEIKGAYNEIWEVESQERYGKSYNALTNKQKKAIQIDFPLVVSEAEPSEI